MVTLKVAGPQYVRSGMRNPAPAFALTAMMVSLAFLAGIVLAVAAAALHRGGRRGGRTDPDDERRPQPCTIPVSLIVPASGEAGPPFTGGRLAAVTELSRARGDRRRRRPWGKWFRAPEGGEWKLEPKEFFDRRRLATTAIRRIRPAGAMPA